MKNFEKIFSSALLTITLLSSKVFATPMTISVHDADLRSTIMLVAKAGNINVSIDDSVKGLISISLSNIEPNQILEIIAKTKNLQFIKDNSVFILTGENSSVALMQSYILPIKYGDAEILRDAVVMSLDADTERLPNQTTRVKNSDGSYTYRYTYHEEDKQESQSTQIKNISRKERVFIDSEANALILFGTPSEYDRVKNLLETLDVEMKQVVLEAKVLAVDKNATKDLGVDWMWSILPQYPEHNDDSYKRNFNDTTGYGIIKFGRSYTGYPFEFYYGAKINALITNGHAKILSRPNIVTIQGKEAIINIGQSVPVPMTQTTNSTITTSFEYKDVGIILKYTPRVNVDGTITAKVHTEVSTPQYVEDLKAYKFNSRSAETTVTLHEGEPMVIGGLISSEEAKSLRKIPFLGDLPILGALFRSHHKSKSESELMIFLTARVIGKESNEEILSDKP